MTNPLRLVVFDCDGTLIDSQHMIVAAMAHSFEAHGLAVLPRAQVLSIVGLSLDEALYALIPHEEAVKRRAITEGYKEAFYHLRDKPELAEPLFEGTREAIEAVAARPDTLLGIATGKSQKGLRHMLEMHNLAHHFVTLQTADDAPSKPHPQMLQQAMREAGVDAANTVLVGDTTYDIEMAVAARAHPIGVNWGYHHTDELTRTGAPRVLTHFNELAPALDALWPASEFQT
ncbi:MAG: HAD-IA family hydrolase [Parvibaculum sp.]|nr:HAD-IA family hydrolase [Parvibaculum sp.]|tara:strand:+ start:241 stop:933 length:693 start_codon:yes stop_codon:yes gene_type:complete